MFTSWTLEFETNAHVFTLSKRGFDNECTCVYVMNMPIWNECTCIYLLFLHSYGEVSEHGFAHMQLIASLKIKMIKDVGAHMRIFIVSSLLKRG